MRRKITDPKSAGISNEKLVLRILRQNGEISQAQVCEFTGLRSSTLSYITGRLREKNLITERTGESTKRGAKPVMLSINPQGKLIISISINPGHTVIGLFDFSCELIEKAEVYHSDNSVDNVSELVENSIRELFNKHQIIEENVLGIGVVVSGTVGPEGVVVLSSPLGWKDVALKKILTGKFQFSVQIYSTRVRFLAETGIDNSLASKSVLYLNVADGVGGTLYTDGKILDGATGRFGELGHIIVEPDGPLCGCGHRGCLEAIISGPSLAKKIKADIAAGQETILSQRVEENDTAESVISNLSNAQDKGDAYALSLRKMIAEYLSRIAAVAINCFDPQVVMLAGYVMNHSADFFAQAIEEKLEREVYDNKSRRIEITQARAGKDVLIKGVAMAVLQDSPEVD